jgi:geranylgeranyl pyrophosphate synthase
MTQVNEFFQIVSAKVDAELDRLLTQSGYASPVLVDAMRWSVFAGGKRFRPALVFASGSVFDADDDILIATAAAVEMLHTYSLIHDDLPSMDNDDLRRGRETCHRRFGEATAILAGDALQAKAFETIAKDERLNEELRLHLLRKLGESAARMVAGQQLDLEAEGEELSLENVELIHSNKTGALIQFSLIAGAMIGNASHEELHIFSLYGRELGLLFQITDDLLDVTESSAALGKTAGKDIDSSKSTYPAVLGIDQSRKFAVDVGDRAMNALAEIDRPAELLANIVDYLLKRRS